jgi:DNA-binding IclR family transcriptional regulator
MAETPSSPIEAVDRALATLDLLAEAGPRGLLLADVAGRLGLHKTTAHRTLAALRHRDFVVQDPTTGAYGLGRAALALGEAYLDQDNLTVLLHPALVALAQDVDELVHLGVLSGRQIVYLDKVEPERPVRVWSAVGKRSPAVTTALGRALLAYRITGPDALAGYAEGLPVDVGHLWEVVRDARRAGYATETEENEPGIACVAVPVLRGQSAIAAVSVTAPVERMAPRRVAALRGRVRAVLPPLLPQGLHLPTASTA